MGEEVVAIRQIVTMMYVCAAPRWQPVPSVRGPFGASRHFAGRIAEVLVLRAVAAGAPSALATSSATRLWSSARACAR